MKKLALTAAAFSLLAVGCATNRADEVQASQQKLEEKERQAQIDAQKLENEHVREGVELNNQVADKATDLGTDQAGDHIKQENKQAQTLNEATKDVVDAQNKLTSEQASFEADFLARLAKVEREIETIGTDVDPKKSSQFQKSRSNLLERKRKLELDGRNLASVEPTRWNVVKGELETSAKHLESDVAKLDKEVTR
jgi:hypothetical protein